MPRIYKAENGYSNTLSGAELQEQAQHMSEEMEKLKSDLKHTSSAHARAESREGEVRSSLMTSWRVNFERFEVSFRLCRVIWLRFREGVEDPPKCKLQLVREELIISRERASGTFRQSCVW